MKILLTGGKGQLGHDCSGVLRRAHEVNAFGRDKLDITKLSEVEALVQKLAPDIILNCAGYTQVDASESQKETAWNVNVKGTENIARVADKQGCQIIHISTDYIFDGRKDVPVPYLENDDPNPRSYYGLTKLESEAVVRRSTVRHIILRTAWTYGFNGHNFLKTMLKLALANPQKELRVVNDQFGSPTWSYRLALQIEQMIGANCRGTYHATAEGHCSWYELASHFLQKMEVPHKLIPCASEEYPTPATRPKNSILENRRLKEKGINVMKHWQDDLDRFISGFRDQLIRLGKG